MPTPYPRIERWRLPQAACELTRSAVMPAGRRGVESGVFWLGDRAATSAITAVAHPTGEGVEETPFSWRVSPEVYAAIARWARPRGLTLLAVAHVHLSEARPRLSPTDRSPNAPSGATSLNGRGAVTRRLAELLDGRGIRSKRVERAARALAATLAALVVAVAVGAPALALGAGEREQPGASHECSHH